MSHNRTFLDFLHSEYLLKLHNRRVQLFHQHKRGYFEVMFVKNTKTFQIDSSSKYHFYQLLMLKEMLELRVDSWILSRPACFACTTLYFTVRPLASEAGSALAISRNRTCCKGADVNKNK